MTFCVCIGFLHCLIGCLSTILKFKGLTTVTFGWRFFVIGIVRKAIVESGLLDRMIHKIDLARVRSASFDGHADGKIETLIGAGLSTSTAFHRVLDLSDKTIVDRTKGLAKAHARLDFLHPGRLYVTDCGISGVPSFSCLRVPFLTPIFVSKSVL